VLGTVSILIVFYVFLSVMSALFGIPFLGDKATILLPFFLLVQTTVLILGVWIFICKEYKKYSTIKFVIFLLVFLTVFSSVMFSCIVLFPDRFGF
jgi:hypothetical protein